GADEAPEAEGGAEALAAGHHERAQGVEGFDEIGGQRGPARHLVVEQRGEPGLDDIGHVQEARRRRDGAAGRLGHGAPSLRRFWSVSPSRCGRPPARLACWPPWLGGPASTRWCRPSSPWSSSACWCWWWRARPPGTTPRHRRRRPPG